VRNGKLRSQDHAERRARRHALHAFQVTSSGRPHFFPLHVKRGMSLLISPWSLLTVTANRAR